MSGKSAPIQSIGKPLNGSVPRSKTIRRSSFGLVFIDASALGTPFSGERCCRHRLRPVFGTVRLGSPGGAECFLHSHVMRPQLGVQHVEFHTDGGAAATGIADAECGEPERVQSSIESAAVAG